MQDRIDCIEKTIAEMQNPMEMQEYILPRKLQKKLRKSLDLCFSRVTFIPCLYRAISSSLTPKPEFFMLFPVWQGVPTALSRTRVGRNL